MHKTLRVLVSKGKRLFRRFLCLLFLIYCLSFLSSLSVHADGNLQLNTDVLMKNGANLGGSGAFQIRGQLFLKEVETQNQKLQESQMQYTQEKQKINFKEKSTESLNTKSMTKDLFKNYEPQVIATSSNQAGKNKTNSYVIGIIAGIILLLLSVWVGNQRAKRKVRKRRVSNDD